MYGELSSEVQRLRENLTTSGGKLTSLEMNRRRNLLENLATSGGKLTSLEMNRRRNLLENLARKCGTVRDKLTELGPVSGAATRTQLLADLGTSSWGVSPGQETNKRNVPNRTGVREDQR